MISGVQEKTLMPIIRCKIIPDSIIYTDNFKSYNVLDVSEFKHLCINHPKNLLKRKITSTALKTFGIKQKDIYESLMAFQKNKFHLFLKE